MTTVALGIFYNIYSGLSFGLGLNRACWIEIGLVLVSVLLGMYYRRSKSEAILLAMVMGLFANMLPEDSLTALLYPFGYAGWCIVFPFLTWVVTPPRELRRKKLDKQAEGETKDYRAQA
jgi:urea transporter